MNEIDRLYLLYLELFNSRVFEIADIKRALLISELSHQCHICPMIRDYLIIYKAQHALLIGSGCVDTPIKKEKSYDSEIQYAVKDINPGSLESTQVGRDYAALLEKCKADDLHCSIQENSESLTTDRFDPIYFLSGGCHHC